MASTTGSKSYVGSGSVDPLPLDLLQGKVNGERKFGYRQDGKKKRILLNAFDMNGIGRISIEQWQNLEDKSSQKNRLPYWIELAKLLEKGKFNALFLADNFGSHDVYKGSYAPAIQLWESSWEDDVVVKDASTHAYTTPSKVRKIVHNGKHVKHVKSESAHQVDPSPQRTPLIFLAGMSLAGSAFASRHAECVFVGGMSLPILALNIEKTRAQAAANGRDPYDIQFFCSTDSCVGGRR
ncbi:unnamed protein product [Clonostachys rosea f. rosea IK726]|uniref:Luciferase-like domain-containing protein n=2 Tax=Bionectria ochroleuca TaxID=29856 RepID=A0A0B7KL54_BIOOC|nr:unnamed protein product [Clonostachys rosea f. rosea IK726]